MKNSILSGLAGLVLGALITMFVMYQMAPGMMILEDESNYNFEESVVKFEESVKAHGWKMPAVHDLQKTMDKFGYDVKSVKVFELCHPDHAKKILEADAERIVSSMMPCRVAIYEKNDGKTYISRMNSALMAKTMSNLIDEVMSIASSENEEILEVLLPTE
ncbi:MAG: hypothetical protein B6I20_04360 [Bacteroidetes bacterium 4572_117]|nr:MAG: hypothetical protein B6I20_04360 [Bacteroidetes bacterium 4572_117]